MEGRRDGGTEGRKEGIIRYSCEGGWEGRQGGREGGGINNREEMTVGCCSGKPRLLSFLSFFSLSSPSGLFFPGLFLWLPQDVGLQYGHYFAFLYLFSITTKDLDVSKNVLSFSTLRVAKAASQPVI